MANTAHVNNVVEFPKEKIVRKVEHKTEFADSNPYPAEYPDAPWISVFEDSTINIVSAEDLEKMHLTDPNEEQILDCYGELMTHIDQLIYKYGFDDEHIDNHKSYYLLQQALLSFIQKSMGEYHILQDVAEHVIEEGEDVYSLELHGLVVVDKNGVGHELVMLTKDEDDDTT